MKKQKEKVVRFEMKLSYDEDDKLKSDSQKANLTKSEYVRRLIMNCRLKEKPDDRFYDILRNLTKIGNNLNQIAKVAHSLKYIDDEYYKKQVEILQNFILKVKEEFLLPKKNS